MHETGMNNFEMLSHLSSGKSPCPTAAGDMKWESCECEAGGNHDGGLGLRLTLSSAPRMSIPIHIPAVHGKITLLRSYLSQIIMDFARTWLI